MSVADELLYMAVGRIPVISLGAEAPHSEFFESTEKALMDTRRLEDEISVKLLAAADKEIVRLGSQGARLTLRS
jgi:hypothetical protein